jgi:hypothetical protein
MTPHLAKTTKYIVNPIVINKPATDNAANHLAINLNLRTLKIIPLKRLMGTNAIPAITTSEYLFEENNNPDKCSEKHDKTTHTKQLIKNITQVSVAIILRCLLISSVS